MPTSALMQVVIDCENHLGWVPTTSEANPLHRARAAQHRILSLAMLRHHYQPSDLALAVAYCRRKRQPITKPIELLSLVETARKYAVAQSVAIPLDAQQQEALDWELDREDNQSLYWITRLTRAVAAGLADVLVEWRMAGRG